MMQPHHTLRIAGLVLLLAVTGSDASGQATTNTDAHGSDIPSPPPAAERIGPKLDMWWQETTFYEIFVRSFADSTTGPLADDGIGDLQGLIERLDYLNDGDASTDDDLGITGIWLMPIAESPSYHGYDVTDYRRIEADYGTNDDFVRLMEECHKRGIRVIVDLVLNHCSSKHPWFRESVNPKSDRRDWFIWADGNPGYRGPWNQRVWHGSPTRDGSFYYGCFYGGMPDLNYANDDVTSEMLDVTRYWLDELNVDGFRLDAIRHLIERGRVQNNTPETHAWLAAFNAKCKEWNPQCMNVGEIWAESEVVSTYVGPEMDLGFEFQLADAILQTVQNASPQKLHDKMAHLEKLYPLGMYASFLRNHDQPRVMHELDGSVERATLAGSILLSLPGVPFIYYGEEIGMRATKPDPQIRTPMQWKNDPRVGFSTARAWIAPKDDFERVNVESQSADPDSILNTYRRMIRLRAAHEALRIGTYTPVASEVPGVLAFTRSREDTTILCVFNLTERSVELAGTPLEELARGGERLSGEGPDATLPAFTSRFTEIR